MREVQYVLFEINSSGFIYLDIIQIVLLILKPFVIWHDYFYNSYCELQGYFKLGKNVSVHVC